MYLKSLSRSLAFLSYPFRKIAADGCLTHSTKWKHWNLFGKEAAAKQMATLRVNHDFVEPNAKAFAACGIDCRELMHGHTPGDMTRVVAIYRFLF